MTFFIVVIFLLVWSFRVLLCGLAFGVPAPVCSGEDLTMPAPALVVCPAIGLRTG
jgi:hypothetical protein